MNKINILEEYDKYLGVVNPKLRKSRGVWYTPEPVVNFIVRAVDDILKTEFNLPQGLADTSKTTVEVDTQTKDNRSKTGYKREKASVHRVQILDPATGTGTFLAEVIKQVHAKFAGQQGVWSQYVENHLIPRLNGFEILMASYAMAHLKLEFLLRETGYIPTKNQRFRVFLTNSLEEHHPDTGTLFASWLSEEATEAEYIKRDTPVMVVLGNPPYSVSSSNKGEWIQNLIADYKKDLNEKKLNLDDDYIKFIRYGEYFIEKNGEGILAFISNNSFIDGVTHRQMRKHLLETFDKIYILDLHGNSKKQEKAPDGSPDKNVFDIMQGVSINIFVKTSNSKDLAQVRHFDLFGARDEKYNFLNSSSILPISWNQLDYKEPHYFFISKDYKIFEQYSKGLGLNNLFSKYSSGIETQRDTVAVAFSKSELQKTLSIFQENDVNEIRRILDIEKDGRDWKVDTAKKDLHSNDPQLSCYNYRPFDVRFVFYTGQSKGVMAYPKNEISKFYVSENIGLVFERTSPRDPFTNIFISNNMLDCHLLGTAHCKSFNSPLYLYPDNTGQGDIEQSTERRPNLNEYILSKIAAGLGLQFTPEKEDAPGTFAPLDLLDYIYAVLHSPAYREKYKEFLKIDFPRVPYPDDAERFWQLVKLGGELRGLHLLESPAVMQFITTYPVTGANEVTRRMRKDDFEVADPEQQAGRVWINDTQYFDGVPVVAWNFYIGGYQPAQKWLKDRKGRQLSFDDIMHYQKVIVSLTETGRIMQEIDGVLVV